MNRTPRPSLLLLPFPPVPPTRAALLAAYRPSLAAALSRERQPDGCSRLVVALSCSILDGTNPRARTLVWSEAQSLVAGIYTVVSAICAELSIFTDVSDGADSVDTTVLLVDHNRKRLSPETADPPVDVDRLLEPNGTVILDLPSFASAYYPWRSIFYVNSETGLQLRQEFLWYAERRQNLLQSQLISVAGGLSMLVPPSPSQRSAARTSGHRVVCLGGTFDHLHPGHKLLLSAGAFLLKVPQSALATPCEFVIGITGDELLKNKMFAEYVQPWIERATNVLEFLATLLETSAGSWHHPLAPAVGGREGELEALFRNGTIRVQCVVIQDPFGPTITRKDIDALVVSAETSSGGEAVNRKRGEQAWPALELFQVDVLDATDISTEATSESSDFSSKLSSTSIRERIAKSRESAGHHGQGSSN